MRKLNVAIIALVFGLSFASCKTEYKCECTPTGDSYTKKFKEKSEAQNWCTKKTDEFGEVCSVSEN